MDIVKIADLIVKIITEIGDVRRQINELSEKKARAVSNYDKKLGIAIITLREEGKFPVTLIEKIAKKLCADERYKMELAEGLYKACISNLEALKAQLNGYQSIYKHLESV